MLLSTAAAEVMRLAQDGHVQAASALADRCLVAAEGAAPTEQAALWYARATIEHVRADFEATITAAGRCAELARTADEPGWVSNALSMRAIAHARAGSVEAALLDLARAEVELAQSSDPGLRCWAHTGLGYAYQELRLYELALPHFETAMRLDASPIPLAEAPVIDLLNLAELHLRWADELEQVKPDDVAAGGFRRHRADGHAYAVRAVELSGRLGQPGMASRARVLELCSRERDAARASLDELRAAYDEPDQPGHSGTRATVGAALARALWVCGRGAEALAIAREAAELSDAAGDWQVSAGVRWLQVQMETEAGLPGAAGGHAYARVLSRVLWQQRLSTLQGATAALDVERLHHDALVARREASEDPLTGVGNRRALDDALRELAAIEVTEDRTGSGTSTSLLLVDLDDFKKVNDTYGHLTGDQVLRAVAEAVRGAARSGDVVARLGGDEFVVLARDTDEEAGARLAERLAGALGSVRLPAPAHELGLSASVGVATTGPEVGVGDLLAAADEQMYGDKARDRFAQRGA